MGIKCGYWKVKRLKCELFFIRRAEQGVTTLNTKKRRIV